MKRNTQTAHPYFNKLSTRRRPLRQRLRGIESLERRMLMAVSIGDYVWNDLNFDGIQNESPSDGVNGVVVSLYTSAGTLVGSPTQTANNINGDPGYYSFNDIAPGDYYVLFARPTGQAFTLPFQGVDPNADSNVSKNGKSDTFTLGTGLTNLSIDAGLVPSASVGNFVWWDINSDGLQIDTEGGIEGATVRLLQNGSQIDSQLTDEFGQYFFRDLAPGTYQIQFDRPVGFEVPSPADVPSPVVGRNDKDDSDGLGPLLITAEFTLAPGEVNRDVDQGFNRSGKVGDYVWRDANNNGIQDEAASFGVNGVAVSLFTAANVLAGGPVITANDSLGNPGYYLFAGLSPGQYYVKFTAPAGQVFTTPLVGSTQLDSDASPSGQTSVFNVGAGVEELSIDAGLRPVDLSLTASVTDTTPPLNATITYSIIVSNPSGLSSATGVTVSDVLPAGLTYVSDNAGGLYSSTTRTWNVGSVAPGDSVLLQVVATVTSGGTKTNFVQVQTADQPDIDSVPGNAPGVHQDDDVTLSITASANIGDYVWRDVNNDGIQNEASTYGINGVTVTLFNSTGTQVGSPTTTSDDLVGKPGYYFFADINPGDYYVQVSSPSGQTFTTPFVGLPGADSNVDGTGKSNLFTLVSGVDHLTIDAGLRPIDLSLTKTVNDSTPRLGTNVTYTTTVTNAGGFSTATGVTVQDTLPAGLTFVSSSGAGTYNSANGVWTIPSVAPGTSVTLQVVATVVVGGTKSSTTQVQTAGQPDFDSTPGNAPGIREDDDITTTITPSASIGNYVWRDDNSDGIQNEPASAGLNGVAVTLYTGTGTLVGSPVVTANDTSGNPGYYLFTDIDPGSYYVTVSAPTDLLFTTQFAAAATQATDSNVDTSGKSNIFTLTSGVDDLTIDAGLKKSQVCAVLDFNGNTSTSGTMGNIRTFASGLISVNASGFSRDRTTGAWASAYLGSYGGGLGVTDSSEGSGLNDTHTVDNLDGRDNYILFEFNQAVVIDTAYLGYVVGDSDQQVWIGTVPNAFNSHQTLSDSLLAGFYTEYNWTELTTTRLADINANGILGNVIVIAADTSDTTPEDRFKLGQMTLCTPSVPQSASIGDFVWHDRNGNGIQDPNEPGIAGVSVTLTGGGADGIINGVGDTQVSTITDASGGYLFADLVSGTQYRAAFAAPTGQIINIDAKNSSGITVTLEPGTYQLSWAGIAGGGLYDAWTYNTAASGSFGNFFSLTLDGVTTTYDRNDGNIAFNQYATAAASIADFRTNGSALSLQTYTGASSVPQSIIQGPITFTITKTSTVLFSMPDSYWSDNGGGVSLRLDPNPGSALLLPKVASPRKAGANRGLDSDGLVSDIVILGPVEQNRTIDAGFYNEVKVGNLVWDDVNADGIKGATEVGIGGVAITLVGTTGSGASVSRSTSTASDGSYLFAGLPPGSYQVSVASSNFAAGGALSGYTASPTLVGADRNVDSNANPSATAPGALPSGANDLSVDFGYNIQKSKVCVNLYLEGNSATSGAAGNIITFASGSVSAKASAFSRDSAGSWAAAYLGRYGGGLGVTDTSEGTGSGNTHTVDNIGRNNYVLFEFSQAVTVDTAFLGYVVGDSDIRVWIGNASNAFNSHYTLSDSFLSGLGFSEVNLGNGSTRTADINASNITGNILVISANVLEPSPNDQFKIAELNLCAMVPTAQSTTKFFSVDDDANKTFKYNSVGTPTQDFSIAALDPRGITSNVSGSNVWIANTDGRIYNYTSAGVHVANWSSKIKGLQGVTTNGTHIWTVSDATDRVYYYPNGTSYANGSSVSPASSFALNRYNNNPTDLTTDGTFIWVVNEGNVSGGAGDMVFKYTLSGTYLGRWQLDAANARPTGITIDPAGGNKIWIVDNATDRIYEYSGATGCVSGGIVASKSYALAPGNTNPQGIADPPGSGDDAITVASSLLVNAQYINPDINPSFNSFNATDVNSDGVTSPLDALLIINRLNALQHDGSIDPEAWIYDDVSNDRKLSPLDALLVINQLNSDRQLASDSLAAPLTETQSSSSSSTLSELGAGEGEGFAVRDAYFAGYTQFFSADSESESGAIRSGDRSARGLRRVSR